jgi:hypothetical protein
MVWERFGDVPNYVEPFAGSLAVMLGRPTPPRVETVNDKDALLANFWRATKADPEAVARYADWPISEVDLHARHLWLVRRREWIENLMTDPEAYDARVAGWWVWGLCQWIGGGWCESPATADSAKRPSVAIHKEVGGSCWRKRMDLRQHVGRNGEGSSGRGIFATARRRPQVMRGRGVHSGASPWRQIPDLQADSGASGRGVHAGRLITQAQRRALLCETFERLSDRLRNVRIVCGEWDRILGPTPTWKTGLTGVFLDPPYSLDERADRIYAHDESGGLADRVREWAIANGDNPLLRIALCGYDSEHAMPQSWAAVRWKAHGGYGSQAKNLGRAQANSRREVVWFSPHCLPVGMFDAEVFRLEMA